MGNEIFLSRKYMTTTEKEEQGNGACLIKQRDSVQH